MGRRRASKLLKLRSGVGPPSSQLAQGGRWDGCIRESSAADGSELGRDERVRERPTASFMVHSFCY